MTRSRRHVHRVIIAALALALLNTQARAIEPAAASTESSADADVQDLIYLGPNRPVVIRFHIRVDGIPFTRFRSLVAERIFRALDADENSILEGKELERIPTAEMLAAAGHRGDVQPSKSGVQFPGRRVTLDQLTAFVLEHSGSPFRLAIARAEASPMSYPNRMNPTVPLDFTPLLWAIDANGDGRLDPAEFARIDEILHSLDLNDDELVSRSELLAYRDSANRPAVASQAISRLSTLLQAINRRTAKVLALELTSRYSSSWRGSSGPAAKTIRSLELGLSSQEMARFDKNGDSQLDLDETAAWLCDPTPQCELDVELYKKSLREPTIAARLSPTRKASGDVLVRRESKARLVLQIGALPLELRVAETAPRPVSRTDLEKARFRRADSTKAGYLRLMQLTNTEKGFGPIEFAAMDRDHNGMVFEDEWLAFVEIYDDFAEHQVTFTIDGTSLDPISQFDANGDGQLNRTELARGIAAIQSWDRNHDGQISEEETLRRFVGTIRPGPPGRSNGRAAMPGKVSGTMKMNKRMGAKGAGPDWFQKMDRNRDGEVSFREFLGPLDVFRKLDRNHDGHLDAAEADQAVHPAVSDTRRKQD